MQPPNGCYSNDDCPAGTECAGCNDDPCCPGCDVCYGLCVPIKPPVELCFENSSCTQDKYCDLGPSCGMFFDPGACVPRPTDCLDPGGVAVCGCDGVTYPDQCHAEMMGVSVSYPGPCGGAPCDSTTCEVFNDCCTCAAAGPGDGPVPCPAICDSSACIERNIMQPEAYCVLGQCILGDLSQGCGSDADCTLVNDCCECSALPTGAAVPSCPEVPCVQLRCDAMGLGGAMARCLGGVCKLSLF